MLGKNILEERELKVKRSWKYDGKYSKILTKSMPLLRLNSTLCLIRYRTHQRKLHKINETTFLPLGKWSPQVQPVHYRSWKEQERRLYRHTARVCRINMKTRPYLPALTTNTPIFIPIYNISEVFVQKRFSVMVQCGCDKNVTHK